MNAKHIDTGVKDDRIINYTLVIKIYFSPGLLHDKMVSNHEFIKRNIRNLLNTDILYQNT